jgi:hypothetical protein
MPCLQLNYDCISNCLVLLSLLSIDYRSGIYIYKLFEALAAIVEKIGESDWVAIAGEWSRKFYFIFGDMAISRQSLQFLDGCKNTKNERLIRWAQTNALALLVSLDSKEKDFNIDILNPVDLQKVGLIVQNSIFFTTKTMSYEKTLLAIGLLRHQVTSFAIRENKDSRVKVNFNFREPHDLSQTY